MTFEVFDCHHHLADMRVLVAEPLYNDSPLEGLYGGLTIEEAGARGGARRGDVPDGQADPAFRNPRPPPSAAGQPGRFPFARGVAEPLHGAVSLDELERC